MRAEAPGLSGPHSIPGEIFVSKRPAILFSPSLSLFLSARLKATACAARLAEEEEEEEKEERVGVRSALAWRGLIIGKSITPLRQITQQAGDGIKEG